MIAALAPVLDRLRLHRARGQALAPGAGPAPPPTRRRLARVCRGGRPVAEAEPDFAAALGRARPLAAEEPGECSGRPVLTTLLAPARVELGLCED